MGWHMTRRGACDENRTYRRHGITGWFRGEPGECIGIGMLSPITVFDDPVERVKFQRPSTSTTSLITRDW